MLKMSAEIRATYYINNDDLDDVKQDKKRCYRSIRYHNNKSYSVVRIIRRLSRDRYLSPAMIGNIMEKLLYSIGLYRLQPPYTYEVERYMVRGGLVKGVAPLDIGVDWGTIEQLNKNSQRVKRESPELIIISKYIANKKRGWGKRLMADPNIHGCYFAI